MNVEESRVVVHVSPHPDDEALGAPGALVRLRDSGWTVVNIAVGLGRDPDHDRRRGELFASTRESGFGLHIVEPPVPLSSEDDLTLAQATIVRMLEPLFRQYRPQLVIGPSAFDPHHGHACVGRALIELFESTELETALWLWNIWGSSEPANLYIELAVPVVDEAVSLLSHYAGELERADLTRLLATRCAYHAAVGIERVLGFGAISPRPTPSAAHLISEVRLIAGRWRAAAPRLISKADTLAPSSQWDPGAVRVR